MLMMECDTHMNSTFATPPACDCFQDAHVGGRKVWGLRTTLCELYGRAYKLQNIQLELIRHMSNIFVAFSSHDRISKTVLEIVL